MTLYDILPQDDKASLIHFDDMTKVSEFEPFYFHGKKQNNWKPVKFKWESENDKYRNNNDFILVHSAGVNIVLTEKAKSIFESLLKNDAQFLPIEIEGETKPFYLLNIIHMVSNALDLKQCKFSTRPNGGQGILKVPVFSDKNIPDNRVFVYPENDTEALVKGELLKEACNKHELTGLEFIPIDNSQIS